MDALPVRWRRLPFMHCISFSRYGILIFNFLIAWLFLSRNLSSKMDVLSVRIILESFFNLCLIHRLNQQIRWSSIIMIVDIADLFVYRARTLEIAADLIVPQSIVIARTDFKRCLVTLIPWWSFDTYGYFGRI